MPRDGYSRVSWHDLICGAQRQMKNNDALFEDSASPIGASPLYTLNTSIFRLCRAQDTARMASLSSSLQWYSNLTSVKQPAYSTIKITNGADIERLYPLLLSYANNSTRANSLREVIVDTY